MAISLMFQFPQFCKLAYSYLNIFSKRYITFEKKKILNRILPIVKEYSVILL